MFEHLQIYDRRERLIVGSADVLLKGFAAAARRVTAHRTDGAPRRILLLRLERIGDFLMMLSAIAAVRERAPAAHIHLVVGSWNESLARLVPGVDSLETLDAHWLSRKDAGLSMDGLARRAWAWRAQGFDLALNFEPDIRSNLLLKVSGSPRRVGFLSGGGGAILTDALAYDPTAHTADNALRLVNAALPGRSGTPGLRSSHPLLPVPEEAQREATRILGTIDARGVLVGIHASAGREVKQWHMDRFARVAARLGHDCSATIVLTGTPDDRPLVDRIISALPADVKILDCVGPMELPAFAALLQQLSVFITCDTGPMHLAAAVGTPVVGLFGPSDPRRYGPLNDRARMVTTDLWCRPCNRVRRPPLRCEGHVPDCMEGIDVEMVYRAARDVLSTSS